MAQTAPNITLQTIQICEIQSCSCQKDDLLFQPELQLAIIMELGSFIFCGELCKNLIWENVSQLLRNWLLYCTRDFGFVYFIEQKCDTECISIIWINTRSLICLIIVCSVAFVGNLYSNRGICRDKRWFSLLIIVILCFKNYYSFSMEAVIYSYFWTCIGTNMNCVFWQVELLINSPGAFKFPCLREMIPWNWGIWCLLLCSGKKSLFLCKETYNQFLTSFCFCYLNIKLWTNHYLSLSEFQNIYI